MCLSWPVGIADARCRLASVHQDIMAHRNSLAPLGYNIFIARQFAIFPNFFRRMIYNKVETSLGVSLFPGPNKTLDIYGAKAVNSFLLIGLPSGQCGNFQNSFTSHHKKLLILFIYFSCHLCFVIHCRRWSLDFGYRRENSGCRQH